MTITYPTFQIDACVIGAGATGLCTASLLTGLGVKCVVVEREIIGSGSTPCAGVLHSGARYAVADPATAEQCFHASRQLALFAPYCVANKNASYFLITDEYSNDYAAHLVKSCSKIGIPVERLNGTDVCREMPVFDKGRVRAAIEVPDYTFDPFMLLRAYEEFLRLANVPILLQTQVSNAQYSNNSWKLDLTTNNTNAGMSIKCSIIIVAAGAWSPSILSGLGVSVAAKYIRGSMFVINRPLCNRIICLCEMPTSGDTLIPAGEVTLIGSTWKIQALPDPIPTSESELSRALFPLRSIIDYDFSQDIIYDYSGMRVILEAEKSKPEKWKRIPQGAYVFDHQLSHNVAGLISVFGGKLTTHLKMATAAIELALQKLGHVAPADAWLSQLPAPKSYLKHPLSFLK